MTLVLPVNRILHQEKGYYSMERIVHIARNHDDAKEWDIEQQVSMTPDERLYAARLLKERVFGKNTPDIRESHS